MQQLEQRLLLHGALEQQATRTQATSIALIDSALPDPSVIEASLPQNTQSIVYNGAVDSARQVLQQVVDKLQEGNLRLNSLLVFSHGTAGAFELGNEMVSAKSLSQSASTLKTLRKFFTDSGSIELFGCDVGEGTVGQSLINRLNKLTGASAYASTNITGIDGDWTLEAHSGIRATGSIAPLDGNVIKAYPDDLGVVSILTPASATPFLDTGSTSSLSVLAADLSGESHVTYTWSATTEPSGASPTFSANATNAAKNTTVTFNRAGSYVFSVAAVDGTSSATSTVLVTVTQTLTSISVSPSTASLALNQSQTLTATGRDQFGQSMLIQPVIVWSLASGVGSVNLLGVYSASTAGTAVVHATSGSIVGSATMTAADTPPTVYTAAAAAPATVTSGTTVLSVLGNSDMGESALTYTWAATTEPSGAAPTFSLNGSNSAKLTSVTFDKSGSYTFAVTISDGTYSTSSSVNVTVQQLSSQVVVSGGTASLNENQAVQYSATAYDQFGNPLATQPTFTWSVAALGVGSVSSTGLYTAPAGVGLASVVATTGSSTGSLAVTVVNAAPTVATAPTMTPNPATGTTAALSVLGADDGGESNLTYTWAATTKPIGATPTFSVNGTNAAKNSTVTFNAAGAYIFTVSIFDGTNTTTAVVVATVSQTFTHIVLSPTSATLNENAIQQFTAVANDQFGSAMLVQPTITWTKTVGIGSISAAGLYTSPGASGTATIQAASGSINASASITINNAAPTVASGPTATPSTVNGTTAALSVLGADDGGESNLTYTWAATTKPIGASPTFSSNGANASKNTTVTFNAAGTYIFTVSVFDGTSTTTATVAMVVNQTFTSIVVTPGNTTLAQNGTKLFTAVADDQFGNAMLIQPLIGWSLASGNGSVNLLGVYTAPASTGTTVIQATSGSISGQGTINVYNSAPTIVSAAAATPSPVTGTYTALTVLGNDDTGESGLTYTWTATTKPAGATPTFTANGTNGAKNTVATFNEAGNYTFTVTISDGVSTTTSSVNVTVAQTLSSITVSPATAALNLNGTQQFSANALDQFGNAMATQPTFSWSMIGLGPTLSATGLFSAGVIPGTAIVSAGSGLVSGSSTVTITNAAPTVATPAAASPSPVTAKTTQLSVLGADDGGESNLIYTWAATTEPTGATPIFSANGTNAAKNSTVTFNQAGSYTFTVTIFDGAYSTTSSVNVTVSQTLTTISVSPTTTALSENQTQQFAATGLDQFGNALSTQPTLTWSKTSGVGAVSVSGLYTSPGSGGAGSAVVQASSGGVSGSATVTVTNAPPTIASAATASPAVDTATTTALSVLGADDGGESNLTYTWAATTKPAGATVTYSANASNAAKNSTATFNVAGNYVFTVTISDGTNTITSSVAVVVTQTLTSISVLPNSTSVNLNQTQSFTATARDQFGNALLIQPLIGWSVDNGGVGTINSVGQYVSTSAGSAVIRATSGSVSGTATTTVTNAAPTITAAAAATPTTVTGTTTLLTVSATDDGGASNLTYTWTATTKPAGATPAFATNGTNSARSDVVTFNEAGAYTFAVAVSDGVNTVTSTVNVTVSQTLTSIAVAPAASTINENQTQQLSATEYDQFGNPITGSPTFTWSKISGNGSVSASGLYTAAGSAGGAVIAAAAGGVSGSASITVVNAAPVISSINATPATVTSTTTALSVVATDDGGEPNLTYTWFVGTEPTGASPTFSANGSNAAKNTTVTFNEAGSYSFTVAVFDGQNTTTSTVSVTVSQTPTTLTVSPTTSALNENQTQQFGGTVLDQFGNSLTTQPTLTWTKTSGIGSVSGSGLYNSPGAAGSAAVRATSGSLAASATVTVTNAAPTVASAPSATPSPVLGTTSALSVLGADDGGEANLIYTWSATLKPAGSAPTFSTNGTNAAKNTTVTFNQAGVYTFSVAIYDGTNTTTASVTITVGQTFTSIALTPASASLHENQTQQFAASALDQFGNAMLIQPIFSWGETGSGASVTQSGLFTSTSTTGSFTVSASSGGVSANAAVTVINAPPTVASGASATPNPITGTSTVLSVLGADDGGESNLTYTWSATSEPAGATPTFSIDGTNAAKNTTVSFNAAGTYVLSVSISDGANTVLSSVTVSVVQTQTSIAVTPATTAINENGTQQFSASALDQFGQPMAVQPTVTWAISAGGGSINSSGLFTAPATAGTSTVSASGGGTTGTGTVTISDTVPTVVNPASAGVNPVTGTSTTLSTLGTSDAGESALNYTWQVTSAPAGAVPAFSVNGTNAAKNTTVTFNKAGAYTFLVTISDGTLTTSSSVNVTVSQTLTAINVLPASATVAIGGTQHFNSQALDQFGNAMATQPTIAWSATGAGTIDPTGLYTAPASAGASTITAAAGGITGTASVTIVSSAAISVTMNSTTGTSAALAVVGTTAPGLIYSWTTTAMPAGAPAPAYSDNGDTTAGNTTLTFFDAGSYTVQVVLSDGVSSTTLTDTFTVAQKLSSIGISPNTVLVRLGLSQPFEATASDQFGNPMSQTPALVWAIAQGGGSLTNAGVYTAPDTIGTAVVRVSFGPISATVPITIEESPPTITTPPGAGSDPVTGTGTTLSVLGSDSGGAGSLVYTWQVIGTPPAPVAFSNNGTNSADNTTVTFEKAGDYSFQVTISDGYSVTTGTVSMTVVSTATGIVVSPSATTVNVSGTRQFSALEVDQFGQAMSVQPTLTWAKTAGPGSIDASGLYTASGQGGSATVTASALNITGSATINVTVPLPLLSQPASTPTPTVTGTTAHLGAVATDAAGNNLLTYTWAMTAGPIGAHPLFNINGTNAAQDATVTLNKAGNYIFTVTISNGLTSITSSISMDVQQVLSEITLTPNAAVIGVGQIQPFVAHELDQFGDPETGVLPPLTWTVPDGPGTINIHRDFESDFPGTSVIAATVDGITAEATVIVDSLVPLEIVTSAYADSRTVTGKTVGLHVLAKEGANDSTLAYQWALASAPSGGTASFSANNSNSAKNTTATFTKPGTYSFVVRAIDSAGATVDSTVSVNVVGRAESLFLLNPPTSVDRDTQTQLTARALDQFGNPIALPGPVSWSDSSAAHTSVGPTSGVFTTGATLGASTITATSGGLRATCNIQVVDPPPVLTVNSDYTSVSKNRTTVALHAQGTDSGTPAQDLTYTWSIVSRSGIKAADDSAGGDTADADPDSNPKSIPDVEFSLNGTNAAQYTTATFHKAGTYRVRCTISDGTASTITDVLVTSHVNDNIGNARLISALTPIRDGHSVTGIAVTFNGTLDPTSAQDLSAYTVSALTLHRDGQAITSWAPGTAGDGTLSYAQVAITAAVYNPATLQVALTFAQPMTAAGQRLRVTVAGIGANAVKDVLGNRIDGNTNDTSGDNFSHRVRLPAT